MLQHLKEYWNNIVEASKIHPERSIRIAGTSYWIYDESTDGKRDVPFGGRKFVIRRYGHTETEVVRMWYHSPIPDQYRELLPDNAEWVPLAEAAKSHPELFIRVSQDEGNSDSLGQLLP